MPADIKTKLDLSNRKFFNEDFSGQDLRGVPMHHSDFICCKFTDKDGVHTNLAGNDCSYSKFNGSDLTGPNCNNTNFAHATLGCKFYPSDAYGMTLTLNCATFKGTLISKLWWYSYVFFALLMVPEMDGKKDLRDSLIGAIGPERYVHLRKIFSQREY